MSVVLWEEDAQSGVIVELEEQRRKNFRSFEALRSAATVGEIRAADLAPWARSIVDSHLEDLAWDHENEGDELATVSDDEPWNYGDVAELVMEAAPLPHDALVAASWLGTVLLREHAAVGGASPGGNIDVYSVADTDAFLAAIEERGYTLRRHSGLMEEYWQAL